MKVQAESRSPPPPPNLFFTPPAIPSANTPCDCKNKITHFTDLALFLKPWQTPTTMLSGQLKCILQSVLFSVYSSKLVLYSYTWAKLQNSQYVFPLQPHRTAGELSCYFTRLWTFKQVGSYRVFVPVSAATEQSDQHTLHSVTPQPVQVVLIPVTIWQKLNNTSIHTKKSIWATN